MPISSSNGLLILCLVAFCATGTRGVSFTSLSKRQDVAEVDNLLGCNATGPLTGKWAVNVSPCEAGQLYTCSITDDTGCNAFDSSQVQSLVATSLVTGPCQTIGGSAGIVSTDFTCPEEGFAACTATLNEDSGVQFGLKVDMS